VEYCNGKGEVIDADVKRDKVVFRVKCGGRRFDVVFNLNSETTYYMVWDNGDPYAYMYYHGPFKD